MACLFGPLLPILFVIGFFGMLITDVVTRIRIAYSVKSFPKYDRKPNFIMLIGLSLCVFVYAISSLVTYSSREVFWNEVKVNKSASEYYVG